MSALELLKSLVAIPSVNPFQYYTRPDGKGVVGIGAEEKMNFFVEEYLRDAGFEVSRQELNSHESLQIEGKQIDVPPRWNVLAVRYPKSNKWNGKSILFFGHSDTVEIKAGWESDPFSISVKSVNGRECWFGLGANDMKGGHAAVLDALRSAESQSYAIKFALLADEEFYSLGADKFCKSDFLNDVVIAIAPEIGDSSGDAGAEKNQLVGIGRTGRIEFDVSVIGRACHGTDAFISKDAINAVHESAKLQCALIEYFTSIRREYSKNGAKSINSAYISFSRGGEAMLSIPDHASFVIDRTFLPDESPEAEMTQLNELITRLQQSGHLDERARISVTQRPRPTPPCKPYITSLESPEMQSLLDSVKRHAQSHSYYIGRAVADENRVALRGIPTVSLGPAGAGSHTSEEWVDPATVLQVNEIFKTFIASL